MGRLAPQSQRMAREKARPQFVRAGLQKSEKAKRLRWENDQRVCEDLMSVDASQREVFRRFGIDHQHPR